MSTHINPMTAAGLAALPGVPTGYGFVAVTAHNH
jgi:hypothetical protein